jgi:eukaryotic-like serine/threonine-protein kinase
MAKDPRGRPIDATAFVTELSAVAAGAYGQGWPERGRSHLGEAALLLAALWPSGPPPAVQGTAVHQVPLGTRTTPSPSTPRWRIRPRHFGAARVAVIGGAAIFAVAASTALASTVTNRPALPKHPVAAVQPVTLQPSPTLVSSSPTRPSSTSTSPSGGVSTSPSQSGGVSTSPSQSVGVSTSPSQSDGVSTSPSQSVGGSTPVPEITGVGTYTQGQLVYFDIHYADPGNDAEGFGFVGVNGSGWAEENHPFTSPSYGIVGPDNQVELVVPGDRR